MFLFILESLGSTELLFILAMALIFFGPRKLPQISRSIGKSLAEFRRASEDFKRTWDREANMEDITGPPVATSNQNGTATSQLQTPSIAAIPADQIVARQATNVETPAIDAAASTGDASIDQPPHVPKHDWL